MDRVIAQKCNQYQVDLVGKKLNEALEALGGLDSFMEKGSKVFLKVNLLTMKKPEEAVTTHPVVVEAFSRILVEGGMNVVIGDSPAGPFLPGRMKQIYRISGMNTAAENSGAELNENVNHISATYPEGWRLKTFDYLEAVSEADYVISLCKMKTHSMTLMTGAVKNLFGAMPGLTKAALHFRFPSIEDFAHAMIDICEYTKPVLSVMDGIEAMEGAGPSAGDVVEGGVLLVSPNPHLLDLAACHWMGISPEKVPLLQAAVERQLIPGFTKVTEWQLGLQSMEHPKPFILPLIHEPDFLKRYREWPLVGKWAGTISNRYLRPRPRVMAEACVGCRECHVICPAKAIHMEEQKPVFDLDLCIRCFCCQEICPEKAIVVHRPRLLKLFHS